MGMSVPAAPKQESEPEVVQPEPVPEKKSRSEKKSKTKTTTYFDSVELLGEEGALYDEEDI